MALNFKIKLIQEIKGHDGSIWSLAWSPLNSLLVSSGEDKNIFLWSNTKKRSIKKNNEWLNVTTLKKIHNRIVRHLSFSPNGKYLAASCFDSTISIWKVLSNGNLINYANLTGHQNEMKCVAWSLNSQYIAACGRETTIWIWDLSHENHIETIHVDQSDFQDIKNIIWHPIYNFLITCNYDDNVKIWRINHDFTLNCVQALKDPPYAHSSTVWVATFNQTNSEFATCSSDKTIKIWTNSNSKNFTSLFQTYYYWRNVSTLERYHTRAVISLNWLSVKLISSASEDNGMRIFLNKISQKILIWILTTIVPNANDQDLNSLQSLKKEKLIIVGDDVGMI